MVDWQQIDTVLLDMDGTLLDLHYDNFFWLEYLPKQFAEKNNLTLSKAKQIIEPTLANKQGQLEWYCTDYWSRELEIDIVEIKKHYEVARKIAFRNGAQMFLQSLNHLGKQVWLVTNAHPDVLAIKCQHLPLEQHFEHLISSHQIGYSKEQTDFWQALQQTFPFNPQRSLFVDDSLPVLRSAQAYGIANLRAIANPDSQKDQKNTEEFTPLDLCLNASGLKPLLKTG